MADAESATIAAAALRVKRVPSLSAMRYPHHRIGGEDGKNAAVLPKLRAFLDPIKGASALPTKTRTK